MKQAVYTVLIRRSLDEEDPDDTQREYDFVSGTHQLAAELQEAWDLSGLPGDFRIIDRVVLGENSCETCLDRGWLFAAPDGDKSRLWLKHCDTCNKYVDDTQAAVAAFEQTGHPISLARMEAGSPQARWFMV